MDLGSRDAFDRTGTLGIEEEFFIVDAEGRPTSGTDELVYESEPPEILDGRLDHELFKFVVETQTPTVDSLSEAREALAAVRSALVEHADRHGFSIAAAGLHPAAKWRELEHAEKPRYRAQLDRIQYPQHRNTTAGVHVHVGVDDADKAVWIANELRWYLPIMLALSANSPYWNGFDTGLGSARAKIFEGLPNTGVPTAFEDFEAFQRFERTMVETGSINDRGNCGTTFGRTHRTARSKSGRRTHRPTRTASWPSSSTPRRWSRTSANGTTTANRDASTGGNSSTKTSGARCVTATTPSCSRRISPSRYRSANWSIERSRLGVSGIGEIYDARSGAEAQRRLRESDGLDALCESLLVG